MSTSRRTGEYSSNPTTQVRKPIDTYRGALQRGLDMKESASLPSLKPKGIYNTPQASKFAQYMKHIAARALTRTQKLQPQLHAPRYDSTHKPIQESIHDAPHLHRIPAESASSNLRPESNLNLHADIMTKLEDPDKKQPDSDTLDDSYMMVYEEPEKDQGFRWIIVPSASGQGCASFPTFLSYPIAT